MYWIFNDDDTIYECLVSRLFLSIERPIIVREAK